MITFKEYINIIEVAGTNGGLEPPKQRPDIWIKDTDGPIEGNIKNSEKPPCPKKMSIKRLKNLIFSKL
jgi:hypothetical protein